MLPQFTFQQIFLIPYAALLIWAAISDITSLRIPNLASIALALLFPLHAFLNGDLVSFLNSILVGLVVFAAGAAMFAGRLLGGGDVKLLAAAALWAGPSQVMTFILVTAIAGGACALIMMSPLGTILQSINGGIARQKLVMPYGVAIAFGGLFTAFKPLAA